MYHLAALKPLTNIMNALSDLSSGLSSHKMHSLII